VILPALNPNPGKIWVRECLHLGCAPESEGNSSPFLVYPDFSSDILYTFGVTLSGKKNSLRHDPQVILSLGPMNAQVGSLIPSDADTFDTVTAAPVLRALVVSASTMV
jgi:hypothetical protein